ncbi:HD domain-containing protein [Streptomyces sp. 4N509B]|uniref:HD domain-containing protein n=1 Tax=Streptomyces sp. 4N509B TaxID=3457413 RepID=UPI003FD3D74E
MGALRAAGGGIAGVKDPETIAEHSFRTAIIGSVLAMLEEPILRRLRCSFHDTKETRVGDIPCIGRRYLTATKNEAVTADQVADAHPAVAAGVQHRGRVGERRLPRSAHGPTTRTGWSE